MDFPRTVDEITSEWLTQVLSESGVVIRANVVSFQSERIGGDTGITGVLNRIRLEYDSQEPGAPGSVVAKHSPDEASTRTLLKYRNAAELRFYKNIADEVGIDVPHMYFGEMDEETAECVLLLEDLGHLRAVDQDDDCSTEDALAVLTGISGVHARYWSDTPDFERISKYLPKITSSITTETLNKNIAPFVELVGESLPDGIEQLARKLAPKISKVGEMLYESPVTLSHTDLKITNMFFDDSVGSPPRVTFYDWQGVRAAKAALDISYFVSANFSTQTRRKIEHQLLDGYHQSLVDQGVKGYSLDEFMYDVRVALLFRLPPRICSTAILGKTMMATAEGRANMSALVERLQTLIDWNCDEVIPK
jgi:hypothetical protein